MAPSWLHSATTPGRALAPPLPGQGMGAQDVDLLLAKPFLQ